MHILSCMISYMISYGGDFLCDFLLSPVAITWPTVPKPAPQHCATLRELCTMRFSIARRPSANAVFLHCAKPSPQNAWQNNSSKSGPATHCASRIHTYIGFCNPLREQRRMKAVLQIACKIHTSCFATHCASRCTYVHPLREL